MFNDGFCDLCHVFKGHEDLLVGRCPVGRFMACSECREYIQDCNSNAEREKFVLNGLNGAVVVGENEK